MSHDYWFVNEGDIPGVALSIVDRSSVLVEAGYGLANMSSGQAMTPDTLLPLGSITKAFTSALLALLIDKHSTDPVKFVHARSTSFSQIFTKKYCFCGLTAYHCWLSPFSSISFNPFGLG